VKNYKIIIIKLKNMFNLKEKIQKSMKPAYWTRGAEIFRNDEVWYISLNDDWAKINFESEVEWSSYNKYEVYIWINKETKKIIHDCECPAHTNFDWCKHISAFVRRIDVEYKIDDDLEVISKVDWNTENEINVVSQLMEMISWIQNKWKIERRQENKLSIFSKIQWADNEEEGEKKDLFKVKLDFIDWWYWAEYDMKMWVYKCKILKNWKLSAWIKVKRNALNWYDIPKEIKKLKLFLDEAWSYRSDWVEGIRFLDDPDYFLSSLFSINTVFNAGNNNILNIDKNIYDLKISVKKKEIKDNTNTKLSTEGFSPLQNYEIKLVLDTKKWQIFFKNFKLVWEKNNKNFAVLRKNWDLLFFKSDLGFDFINELNSGDLSLSEEEFEQLKSSAYFENIIKHSNSIDDLWLEKIIWDPKWKIIIEIDENFENVVAKVGMNYGDNNNVFLEDFGKVDFFVDFSENKLGNTGLHSLQIQRIIIERNKTQEKNILEKLEKISDISDEKTIFWFEKMVDDKVDDFFDEIEKLIEEDFIVEYAQKTKRVSNQELWLKVNVKSGVDFFDTKTALILWEKEIVECSELLDLLAKSKNKKSVTLKNWMTVLIKNNLEKSLELLEEMWIDKKDIGWENIAISKHNIGLLKDKKLKWDLIDFELDKETLNLKKSLSNFSGIRKIKIPENVKANLRDYQQTWYNWLNFLEKYNFSWILADDMGLWKTLQTLALLQKIYHNSKLKQKSLVVCPTSLVFNWLDEAKKFTPDLKIEYIKDWKTAFSKIKEDTQVVIVSYWIIANLSEKWDLKEKFHYLILDEAQNIKNPAAKRTKSICKIVAKYRLWLSWTPIENNLMELWSGFNFLMPGFLNNLNNFKSKYMWAKADKDAMKNLSAKVKPFILRRKKEDVLKELPAKVEEVIKLEMWEKQKSFYTKLKNTFKLQITKELEENWLNKSRFMVLDSLLKLRQACLTPELIPLSNSPLTGERIKGNSIKLDYIKDSIDEMLNNWHNLLIFSQFTGFLKYVREILEEKEIEYNYLDWQTPAKNRKWLVDEFNNWKKQVFIISLKAGWTGLNLTKADYVIHLDPWWNPAVENQATDRAHRMWQKKTVFVQKLICRDSIEEKILELQEKKKKLIDDVFSWNFSGSLSKEDIDFIFE